MRKRTLPSLTVVLSSYNGEKYIKQQIESIIGQNDVSVIVYVRDDGSKDSTTRILQEYTSLYDNVLVEYGENVGFKDSFMLALKHAPESDYYAFSDQDDIWYPNKLIKSISLIKDISRPALCVMNAYNCDSELRLKEPLYCENRSLPNKEITFVSPIGHGFLLTFNDKLKTIASSIERSIPISHDLWIGAVASYIGEIVTCSEIVALHRRLKHSLSLNRPVRTFLHRISSLFVDRGVAIGCSKMIVDSCKDLLDENDAILLRNMTTYRNKFQSKLALLSNKRLRYPGFGGRVIIVTKILLNRF